MKYFVLVCFLVVAYQVKGQVYNTSYDDIDVDAMLKSKRLLNNYIRCLLDEGPCTPEGRELRRNIPEAIVTNCVKCSAAQRKIIKKVSGYIMKNRPQDWSKIKKKFDPQDKYRVRFEKFLKEPNE